MELLSYKLFVFNIYFSKILTDLGSFFFPVNNYIILKCTGKKNSRLKGSGSSLKEFLAIVSPLKRWKKLFISPQMLLLFSSYVIFFLNFMVMQQNDLIRKPRLFSNFVTSQSGLQLILIYILPNTLRKKRNQIMKFGLLIEYNVRNIFLEKSCTKCSGESSRRPFSGKSKLRISLDQQSKVLYSLFLLYPKLRAKYIKIY